MATRHGKSSCCGKQIQRHGARRRQCCQCGRTWRIRKRKRGRKPRRIAHELVLTTLRDRDPLVRQARRRGLSPATLRRRFRQALQWFLYHSASPEAPSGDLVLIIDALWFSFRKQRWTLYLLALKPITAATARFLDPVLSPGMESLSAWRVAVQTIPSEVRSRIKAMVSDGFRGSKSLARDHGWIHQRCHFHLIAQLHGRRGRVKRLRGREVREAIYQQIREVLVTANEGRILQLRESLQQLAHTSDCPKRLQMYTLEFLRELNSFRAYLQYPELQLPTTTNVIEAMGNVLRDQLRRISTPQTLEQWATAIIRLRPPLVCNGSKNPPN